MTGKGIQRESLHIDRIIEELGYVEGNLQILPNHENLKKRYLGRDENNNAQFKTIRSGNKNYDSSTDTHAF